MRTIFREQAHEKPVAGGRYQYRRDGHPTGSYERWRLTEAAEGYYYLRVDLNADAGEGGDSTLYHLTLSPDRQPERLSFRHFRRGQMREGNVLFEQGTVSLVQSRAGGRTEEEVALPTRYAFWFPTTAALSLLAGLASEDEYPAVTLVKRERFGLQQTVVSLSERQVEQVEVMGRMIASRPLIIRWETEDQAQQQRTLWLDENGWPIKMARSDGLEAIETRGLRYRRA